MTPETRGTDAKVDEEFDKEVGGMVFRKWSRKQEILFQTLVALTAAIVIAAMVSYFVFAQLVLAASLLSIAVVMTFLLAVARYEQGLAFSWDSDQITQRRMRRADLVCRWDEVLYLADRVFSSCTELVNKNRSLLMQIPWSAEGYAELRTFLERRFGPIVPISDITRADIDAATLPARLSAEQIPSVARTRVVLALQLLLVLIGLAVLAFFGNAFRFAMLAMVPFFVADAAHKWMRRFRFEIGRSVLRVKTLRGRREIPLADIARLEFGLIDGRYRLRFHSSSPDTDDSLLCDIPATSPGFRSFRAACIKAAEDYCHSHDIDPATRIFPPPPENEAEKRPETMQA